MGAFSRTTITNLMEFVDGGFGGCDGFIKARTEHSSDFDLLDSVGHACTESHKNIERIKVIVPLIFLQRYGTPSW